MADLLYHQTNRTLGKKRKKDDERPKARPKSEPGKAANAPSRSSTVSPTSSNPAVLHRAGGAIKPAREAAKPGVTAPKPRPPSERAELRPKPRPKTEPSPKPRPKPAVRVAGDAVRAAALGGAVTGIKSTKAMRPKPRPTAAEEKPAGPMAKLAALMRGNKGHNESLALRRQRKAMRKG